MKKLLIGIPVAAVALACSSAAPALPHLGSSAAPGSPQQDLVQMVAMAEPSGPAPWTVTMLGGATPPAGQAPHRTPRTTQAHPAPSRTTPARTAPARTAPSRTASARTVAASPAPSGTLASPTPSAPSQAEARELPAQQPQQSPQPQELERQALQPFFLVAKLTGRAEVPVAGGPAAGDPAGSAVAAIRVQGASLTFVAGWKGIAAPTLGHIHAGRAGVNGPVEVPLFATPMPGTATAAAGKVALIDPAVAAALRKNPSAFYVNLHTSAFPAGAVRGQLSAVRTPQEATQRLQGTTLKASLNGGNEVPAADGTMAGDPDAQAAAFITPHGTQVDYAIGWTGLAPTLGHVHQGAAGANGPVVVGLFGSAPPATLTAVAGTVSGVDSQLITSLRRRPQSYYVNLHSAAFPMGAARGQLSS